MWFVESIPAYRSVEQSCSFEWVELKTQTNFLTKSKGHCLSDAHSTVCTRPAALIWIVSSVTLIITFFFFFSKRTFQGDELEAAVSRWHGSAWKGTRCLADNCHDPLISQEDGLGHFRRVGPSFGNMNARCLCLIMIQIIKSITVTSLAGCWPHESAQGSGNQGPRRPFLPLSQVLSSLPRAAGSGDTQRFTVPVTPVLLFYTKDEHVCPPQYSPQFI